MALCRPPGLSSGPAAVCGPCPRKLLVCPCGHLTNFAQKIICRLGIDFCYEPDGRQDSAPKVVEQSARNTSAVFTAWEYSHCRRSICQFSGTVFQFAVAWLAGNVQKKKIASIRAKQSAAATSNQNGPDCARPSQASSACR